MTLVQINYLANISQIWRKQHKGPPFMLDSYTWCTNKCNWYQYILCTWVYQRIWWCCMFFTCYSYLLRVFFCVRGPRFDTGSGLWLRLFFAVPLLSAQHLRSRVRAKTRWPEVQIMCLWMLKWLSADCYLVGY